MGSEWYARLTSGLGHAIIRSPRRRLIRIRIKLRGRIPAMGRTTPGRALNCDADDMWMSEFT
jgi:hypothetical protein